MIEWFKRLIGGWLPIGTKPFGEYAGKILWCVGIVLMVSLCTNVWDKLFPGKPNVNQFAAGSNPTFVAEPRDMMGFGCSIMRAYVRVGVKTK
jgi:hypothetical protein